MSNFRYTNSPSRCSTEGNSSHPGYRIAFPIRHPCPVPDRGQKYTAKPEHGPEACNQPDKKI